MFEIFMVVALVIGLLLLGTHYFGWKYSLILKLIENLFADKSETNLKQTSLDLLSVGSVVGIGIGITICSFVGGSLLIGLSVIAFGLFSLHKSWFLVIQ